MSFWALLDRAEGKSGKRKRSEGKGKYICRERGKEKSGRKKSEVVKEGKDRVGRGEGKWESR
jgi:hypothetical protein